MTQWNKLEEKIKELEEEFEFKDNDEEWLDTFNKGDTNEYFWFHCGERDELQGRIDGLKEALNMLKEIQK